MYVIISRFSFSPEFDFRVQEALVFRVSDLLLLVQKMVGFDIFGEILAPLKRYSLKYLIFSNHLFLVVI